MGTTISRRYHFECAHWLPNVPETHKCHRIHGHNYEAEVTLAGNIDPRGFLIDFAELDAMGVHPVIHAIDHRVLNDIPGLFNPTAEIIAQWFHDMVSNNLSQAGIDCYVQRVRIYETKDCWADYEPKLSNQRDI